jgi:flagellar biosynthesis protein FlhG
MPDQAAGLRSLFARRRPSLLIVAGNDPCKAAVAVHFAREAAAGGRATLLIDGTAGQVAIACDQSCRYELSHVLAGDKPLADVLRQLTPHLMLLPAARALSRFGSFTADEEARLNDAFSNGITAALTNAGVSEAQVDLIVVNAEEAHAVRAVEAFGRDARVVIVASDYATSLRGAYVEMKALSQQGLENFEIVVPRFDEAAAAGLAFANLSATARRFLEIELTDGGSVLLKPSVSTVDARRTSAAPNTTPVTATDELADVLGAPPSDSSFATSTSQDEVPHAAVA